MTIPIFQIDAFTERPFGGNPAAVCLMSSELDDTTLQNIAMEMNLAETAFVWKQDDGFKLRWFAPKMEIDLCGHATLAATQAMLESGWASIGGSIEFHTRSGVLTALPDGNQITLDFPAKPITEAEAPVSLTEALGVNPVFTGKNGFDFFVVVETENEVRRAVPNFFELKKVDTRGVILTAKGSSDYDFISRFFCPLIGIDEDPVTGSAHVSLAPYWGEQLGKTEMTGYQASQRGGIVRTRLNGERVELGGQAVVILKGELSI